MIRKYLLSFLLLLCFACADAQKLDSLLQKLSKHPKEDTVRFSLLINTASEYENTDPGKGEKMADSAVTLAKKLNDNGRVAQAMMNKGDNQIKLKNNAEALNSYQQSLMLFQQLMNKNGMVTSLIGLGNIKRSSGDYNAAIDYYARALDINKESGNKERTAIILFNMGIGYRNLSNYTKGLENLKKAFDIYVQLGKSESMCSTLLSVGGVYERLGDYETELSYYQKALTIAEKLEQKLPMATTLTAIGALYTNIGNNSMAIEYLKKALVLYRQMGEKMISSPLGIIGVVYSNQSKYFEAIPYLQESIKIGEEFHEKQNRIINLNNLGFAYYKLSDYKKAWACYQQGLSLSEETGNKDKTAVLHLSMGELIRDAPDSVLKQIDINPTERYAKTLEHFNKGNQIAIAIGSLNSQRYAWEDLSILYEKQKDFPGAFEAYKNFISTRDSILNNEKEKKISHLSMQYEFDKKKDSIELQKQLTEEELKQQLLLDKQQQQQIELGKNELAISNQQKDLQNLAYLKTQADLQNEQLQKKEKEKQLIIAEKEKKLQQADAIKTQYNNRVRMYFLFGTLAVFLLLAIILWRNNRNKQHANVLLLQQKQATDQQKTKAETAFYELKATQNQLVQREKMASLGELTAGIAHEIQNPLNFVNNFSEVNTELIQEIEEEIRNGNLEAVKLLAFDIKSNMEKINLHGKRADSIVKGMLQHSRSGTDKPQLTDINALTDEYLRLSYHGIRAKDKSFNTAINTDFDKKISRINIVQQDISRALLNIFNNAFYSVMEKKKLHAEGYDPLILVTTKMISSQGINSVELRVRDNGMGISEKTMGKIFQPFFTTKPPGMGTGLGLSLTYDIITKGLGGTITAETRQGDYAEFIIHIPA